LLDNLIILITTNFESEEIPAAGVEGLKWERVQNFLQVAGIVSIIIQGLLPIEWVISVDFPSAHVFPDQRGLAGAQGAHPAQGRTS